MAVTACMTTAGEALSTTAITAADKASAATLAAMACGDAVPAGFSWSVAVLVGGGGESQWSQRGTDQRAEDELQSLASRHGARNDAR